jgi:hypothetical protein
VLPGSWASRMESAGSGGTRLARRLKVHRDGGGLVIPGYSEHSGGLRHRLGRDEQTMIMRLRDQTMMQANIARATVRHPRRCCGS